MLLTSLLLYCESVVVVALARLPCGRVCIILFALLRVWMGYGALPLSLLSQARMMSTSWPWGVTRCCPQQGFRRV